MSDKFILIALLLWGAFLVLVGTFGGKAGQDVSGGAAGLTVFLIIMYGLYRGTMD